MWEGGFWVNSEDPKTYREKMVQKIREDFLYKVRKVIEFSLLHPEEKHLVCHCGGKLSVSNDHGWSCRHNCDKPGIHPDYAVVYEKGGFFVLSMDKYIEEYIRGQRYLINCPCYNSLQESMKASWDMKK